MSKTAQAEEFASTIKNFLKNEDLIETTDYDSAIWEIEKYFSANKLTGILVNVKNDIYSLLPSMVRDFAEHKINFLIFANDQRCNQNIIRAILGILCSIMSSSKYLIEFCRSQRDLKPLISQLGLLFECETDNDCSEAFIDVIGRLLCYSYKSKLNLQFDNESWTNIFKTEKDTIAALRDPTSALEKHNQYLEKLFDVQLSSCELNCSRYPEKSVVGAFEKLTFYKNLMKLYSVDNRHVLVLKYDCINSIIMSESNSGSIHIDATIDSEVSPFHAPSIFIGMQFLSKEDSKLVRCHMEEMIPQAIVNLEMSQLSQPINKEKCAVASSKVVEESILDKIKAKETHPPDQPHVVNVKPRMKDEGAKRVSPRSNPKESQIVEKEAVQIAEKKKPRPQVSTKKVEAAKKGKSVIEKPQVSIVSKESVNKTEKPPARTYRKSQIEPEPTIVSPTVEEEIEASEPDLSGNYADVISRPKSTSMTKLDQDGFASDDVISLLITELSCLQRNRSQKKASKQTQALLVSGVKQIEEYIDQWQSIADMSQAAEFNKFKESITLIEKEVKEFEAHAHEVIHSMQVDRENIDKQFSTIIAEKRKLEDQALQYQRELRDDKRKLETNLMKRKQSAITSCRNLTSSMPLKMQKVSVGKMR